jgi:hypothetical protein
VALVPNEPAPATFGHPEPIVRREKEKVPRFCVAERTPARYCPFDACLFAAELPRRAHDDGHGPSVHHPDRIVAASKRRAPGDT